MIAACDVVLLVVRPTARSVQGAAAAVELLRRRLGDLLLPVDGLPWMLDRLGGAARQAVAVGEVVEEHAVLRRARDQGALLIADLGVLARQERPQHARSASFGEPIAKEVSAAENHATRTPVLTW